MSAKFLTTCCHGYHGDAASRLPDGVGRKRQHRIVANPPECGFQTQAVGGTPEGTSRRGGSGGHGAWLGPDLLQSQAQRRAW